MSTPTEQLNFRIRKDEKKQLTAQARAQHKSVSEFVRGRLFGAPLSDADQLLIDGLVHLRAHVESSVSAVNADLAAIARMRAAAAKEDAAPRRELPAALTPDALRAALAVALPRERAPTRKRRA